MRKVPSQLHPHHCDGLSRERKALGAAQQGVNDLVYWTGKQEVGSCQSWGPGKGQPHDSGVRFHKYLCKCRREEKF